MVVTDMSLTQDRAGRKCTDLLGPGASLVNITTEEEYYVISGALNAMDTDTNNAFWVAGHVNQPHKAFHKWGHCEPGNQSHKLLYCAD